MDELTRHDVPNEIAGMTKIAVARRVIDALDALVLGVKHGTDWSAYASELVDYAFVMGYPGTEAGRVTHAAITELYDAYAARLHAETTATDTE